MDQIMVREPEPGKKGPTEPKPDDDGKKIG
jgi:hypothetical protein